MKRSEPKILTIDLETLPATFYGWRTGNTFQSLDMMVEPGRLHGVGYQWADKKTAKYIFADGDGWVQEVWDLLNEADIVVTFNGAKFDIPHLQREFGIARLGEPSPFVHVDLYKVGKKVTGESGKLQWFVSTFLGDSKLSTGGFSLWKRCMDGDPKAHALMARYCRNDVQITTKLFWFMREQGWVKNVHWGLFTGNMDSCPSCGSEDRQSRGTAYTRQTAYRQYRCNSCGKWYRSTKGIDRVTTSVVA